ncbi:hypothetical protein Tco_0337148 [Tanacetum coccineum]
MASEQFCSGLGLKPLTPGTISSRLVPNIPSSTSYVPPIKNDWEISFQPMFDEYLNPPPSVDLQVPAFNAPELVISTGTPSSTTIDQDAPSTSTSQTTPEIPSPVIPLGVKENSFVEFPILEPSSEESSTQVVIPNHVHSINQLPEYINKWSKDHPLNNVIGDPSRQVSTRQQDEALLCYFDAFLSSVEPKSYKDALTESCWIEAMQEELIEFECLEVWELVPLSDHVMIITLKWIYKEEGIDFEESFALVARLETIHIFIAFVAHMNMVFSNPMSPRAWYDLLSSFLLSHKFTKGTVDPTLFVRHKGKDILLSQRLFLNQSKYALELLKKYGMETCELGDTPMVEKSKLDEDPQGKVVDPTCYHVMIGTLIYLTSSRPDLVFAVCMCARYQTKPTEKHLHAVKRIFRYLRGSINIGLEYPKDSCIGLTAFVYADHAGCQDTRKSTSGSMKTHHFIKEKVENGVVELYFVRTEYQLTDIFTKTLARELLEFLIKKLGMQSMSPETLKNLANANNEVQGTDSYEFLLANKKCVVNADVFRMILDIYPRMEGVDFANVPDDDATLAFLIELGYKGPLYKYTNIENVNYPDLIWEDLAYQIDHRKEKRSRLMLNDAIKQSESYQMFIKYSTGQIPPSPKKSRGKGSQGKKTIDDPQETVDVSEESEPEPVKKKTASRRVVKKKVTFLADENIISNDPNAALESSRGVTIQDTPSAPKPKPATTKPKLKAAQSLTPAKKEDVDIMQAFKESKKTSKRQPHIGGSSERTGTIPGVLYESTFISATSSEGSGSKTGVPDEEKDITKENVILEWGSEHESKYSKEDKPDDEEKDDKEGDVDDEGDDHISDTKDADDEDDETESDKEDIYKYKIRVRKDEDEEMLNAKAEDSGKGDEEVTDVAKADAEKTSEVKDDAKKTKLPPTSSSLSISSVKIQSEVSHIQSSSILKVPVSVISEPSVLTPVQESSSIATAITLPLLAVSTTPPAPQQTTTPIPTPPITTDAPIITTVVFESDALSAVQLRVAKLEKDMSELKKIYLSAEALVALKTQVPSVVDNYLGSKQILELSKKHTPTFDLERESEKISSEILKIKKEQAEKQKMSKFTIKSTDKPTLKEYDLKSALYQTMHANKSFNKNPANHRLYHALREALIKDENAIDKRVADTVQDHKRKHYDDDEDPPARPN